MKFCVIAACEKNGGIGKQGAIPWRSSIDMNYFRSVTQGVENVKNVLVMGRCTFESVGSKNLGKNRVTVVLSHEDHEFENKEIVCYNGSLNPVVLKDFLLVAFPDVRIGTVFYCGGQTIYEQALTYAPLFDSFLIWRLSFSFRRAVFHSPQSYIPECLHLVRPR